jgi:hypothetical protein
MSTWTEKKSEFQGRYNQITTSWNQVETSKQNIQAMFERAIKKGAKLTSDEMNNLQNGLRQIFDTLKNHEALVRDVNSFVQSNLINSVTSNTTNVSSIHNEISTLKDKIETTKSDYETAVSRRQSVEEPRKNLSNYQGFSGLIAFDRPLKKYSVAILLGFGVFMILVGTLMLRDIFTSSPASSNIYNIGLNTNFGESQEIFSMANIATMIGGMIFFFAVMGIFAYTGYFGKRL